MSFGAEGPMGKRLLILIDNEPVTSRALVLDLQEAGYSVETASDGDEVVEMSQRVPFDLLIAAEEPGDGEDPGFVSEFRRVRPAAKVVLMTTEAGEGGRFAMSETGARVRKPFDLEAFRALVDRLLSAGSAAGSAM